MNIFIIYYDNLLILLLIIYHIQLIVYHLQILSKKHGSVSVERRDSWHLDQKTLEVSKNYWLYTYYIIYNNDML